MGSQVILEHVKNAATMKPILSLDFLCWVCAEKWNHYKNLITHVKKIMYEISYQVPISKQQLKVKFPNKYNISIFELVHSLCALEFNLVFCIWI